MKHPNIRRLIPAALVLVLILSVLPLSALAFDSLLYNKFYNSRDARFADEDKVVFSDYITVLENSDQDAYTIGLLESGRRIERDGKMYEFMGFGSRLDPDLPFIDNGMTSISIPELPMNATAEEEQLWLLRYSEIIAAYAPEAPQKDGHVHKPLNDQWFHSDTNHWQVCKTCGQFYNMNWHWDRDGDGLCDDCGMKILRYPIKVLEFEGGKVTVSQKDGVYNDIIEVTVETDPGYTFKQIHFYQLDEKRHELTRWEDEFASQYHFKMPYYDVEIETEIVKN